jgi:hypothetical protein
MFGHTISLVNIRNTFLTLTLKLICHRQYFCRCLQGHYWFPISVFRFKLTVLRSLSRVTEDIFLAFFFIKLASNFKAYYCKMAVKTFRIPSEHKFKIESSVLI